MKTQDQNALNTQTTQGPGIPKQKGNGRLLTGIGAVFVVVVLIAVSVTVFTVWRAAKGPGNAPPQGQWKAVLNGYVLSSLAAAYDNPAIVYVCAAYTGNSNVVSSDMTYTVSRSTDFGNSWQTSQDSGHDSAMKGFCQLAVNPSDSNDLYAVGGMSTAQNGVVSVLKHSADGGQTWTTIRPVLHFPVPGPAHPSINWQVRQITVVGNALFGIQWIAGQAGPPRVSGVRSGSSLPAIVYAAPHLTESTDGGHNWSVIDKNISTIPQGVRSYMVDPTNTQTIYALVGTLWWPGGAMNGAPNERGPNNYGLNGTLYKTTNGGSTWKSILKNLRYGTEVQIASGNPNVLYVGGLNIPIPLGPQPAPGFDQGQGATPAYPATGASLYGSFQLQVSQDGGASWHSVATAPEQFGIQTWFVSAGGQLYAASSSSYNGSLNGTSQPTVIVGTVVPSGSSSLNPTQRTVYGQPSMQARSPYSTPNAGTPGKVMCYDPANNSWQNVTQFSVPGSLFTVTPTRSNSGAVLWLTGVENGKAVLYRYIA